MDKNLIKLIDGLHKIRAYHYQIMSGAIYLPYQENAAWDTRL